MTVYTAHRILYPEATGVPILCIHGVGSSMASWEPVVERLSDESPIVTYDLRGHGASDKPAGPYELDDFVADALQLLRQLGISRCDVVGFSLGGLIAQAIALAEPDLVRRLVLIGTIAGRSELERERVLRRYQELVAEGPAAIAERSVERWFTPEYLEAHPEAREETIREMTALDRSAYTAAYRVLATSDLADRLHELHMPTLAIAGSGDVGSPPHMAQLISETVVDGHCVVIEGVKHNMLSVSVDRIAKEITTHVSE